MIGGRPAYGSVTAALGTVSFTVHSRMGFIRHILITPTTSTTTFDVKIVDSKNNEIYNAIDEEGVLNERLELPTYNSVTVTIENASVDEQFDYHFALEE